MTGIARRMQIAVLLAVCWAACVSAALPAFGQGPDSGSKHVTSAQHHFTVTLPSQCRHEEGPGTIDAICSPDSELNGTRTAGNRLTAFVLQVSAEAAAEDAGKSPSELAERYTEAMFIKELPAAVCGESDNTRAKVRNVKTIQEETRVVYTADVVCSSVRFLQVPERTASVRFIVSPGARYRLIARATSDEFEKEKAKIDAFFANFAITSAVDDRRP